MRNYYTSIPDLITHYGNGGLQQSSSLYYYDGIVDLNGKAVKIYNQHKTIKPDGCIYLKEIRLFISSQNRILTLDDVAQIVPSTNKRYLQKIRTTIEFYEQSGLISYVPNYEGDELLFTNTKYFKKIWNG